MIPEGKYRQEPEPTETIKDLSPWGRILDLLQRTEYSTMARDIRDIKGKEAASIGDIMAPLYKWNLPEEQKPVGADVLAALSEKWAGAREEAGLPERGYGDTLKEWAENYAKYPEPYTEKEQKILGPIYGIVRDPLTMFGFGGRAAVSFAGKPLIKAPKVMAGLARAKTKALAKIPAYFRRGALTGPTKTAMEAAQEWKIEKGMESMGHLEDITKAVKEAGTDKATLAQITKVVEKTGERADEAVRIAAKKVEEARDFWEVSEKALSVPSLNQLDEEGKGLNYILHLGTKEMKKVFGQIDDAISMGLMPEGKLRVLMDGLFGSDGVQQIAAHIQQQKALGMVPKLAPFHKSMVGRHIAGSVDWINDVAHKVGYGDLFHADPRKLAAVRIRRMIDAGYKAKFLEGLADGAEGLQLAVKQADMLPQHQGWVGIGDDVLKYLKKDSALRTRLADLRFDPDVFADVKRVFGAYIAPNKNLAAMAHDKVLSIMKQITLLPFIPYHLRNDFSDAIWFNTVMRGVTPQYWDDGMTLLSRLADAGLYPKWAAKATGVGTPYAPFAAGQKHFGALLKKMGLAGFRGNLDEEIKLLKQSNMLQRLVGRGYMRGETGGFGKTMGKLGGEMGNVREDWARLTQYLFERDAGETVTRAVGKTTSLHYNYARDGLSPFELGVPARLFYFYRWPAMNIPGSIRNMAHYWGKHTTMAKIIKGWESMWDSYGEEYMPDWMKKRAATKVFSKGGIGRYLLLESVLPPAEIARVAEPLRFVGESLAPLPKILSEWVTGQDIYFQEPIKRYEGERKEWAGQKVPAEIAHLLRQVRAASEIHRTQRRVAEAETPGDKAKEILRSVFLGSRTYTFDPMREARHRHFETIEDMGMISGAMKRAKTEGEWDEYLRLEALLRDLQLKQKETALMGGLRH